jgi:hypothetical protein
VGSRRRTKIVQDYTGLHAGKAPFRVQLHDPIEVARHVHHDGGVRGLPGEAGTAAAESQWRVVVAADEDSLREIVGIERPDDADWELPVVGRIGSVERAVSRPELNFATHAGTEIRGQPVSPGKQGRGARVTVRPRRRDLVLHRLRIPVARHVPLSQCPE